MEHTPDVDSPSTKIVLTDAGSPSKQIVLTDASNNNEIELAHDKVDIIGSTTVASKAWKKNEWTQSTCFISTRRFTE